MSQGPTHSFIRLHQLSVFFLVTFGYSWSVWFTGMSLGYGDTRWLQAVGAWGPVFGALVVTRLSGYSVRGFLRQVIPKRTIPLRWYGVALLIPVLLTQTGVLVGAVTGEEVSLVDPSGVVLTFVFTLFIAGSLEEFGWRGFLQPRIQERRSEFVAALVVGMCWWLWHLPLLLGGTGAGYDSGAVISLLVGLPLFSIVMAWLYNSTHGGLLFVMLFHAMINATPILEADTVSALMGVAELSAIVGIPLCILLYYGRKRLAARGPNPPVPGRDRLFRA